MASRWSDLEDEWTEAGKAAQLPEARRHRRCRAAPNGGDLDPGMACPLGSSCLKARKPRVLGLGGPSELAESLRRQRMELPERSELPELELPVATKDLGVAELLRSKLMHLARDERGARAEVLGARVGRLDVAEHIVSFLPESQALLANANGGLMLESSGSANLDLFFQVLPQAVPEDNAKLRALLAEAWKESPEVCLRQIFLLGASREGKQDRYSFYDALLWLWQKQPATVLANLHLVPQTCYWKALLELLARVCEGPKRSLARDEALAGRCKDGKLRAKQQKHLNDGWKPGSRLELAEEALKRYDADPLYRSLFERIGKLFAEQLRHDLSAAKKGERVGLCAKWCPTPFHSFDRRTLLCESVARWLFPASRPEFAGLTERQYAYRARDRLRGVLAELREYTKSPERLMCQKRWGEIAYKAVPATCMRNNASHFLEHDSGRFMKHLERLAGGQVTANVGALLPHEILRDATRSSDPVARTGRLKGANPVGATIAQAQWEALVAKVREESKLEGCVAVCDVSGSMMQEAAPGVTCMDVAVALSLLLAEVAEGSYARKLITFSEDPRIVELPRCTKQLPQLNEHVRSLPWGMSTNFQKVFEMLLHAESPPKRVFVFSDMQFDAVGGEATGLQQARQLYGEQGKTPPELVFWNLAQHSGAPASAEEEGVALVSGFSTAMVKVLLAEGAIDAPRPPVQAIAALPESGSAMEEESAPSEAEPWCVDDEEMPSAAAEEVREEVVPAVVDKVMVVCEAEPAVPDADMADEGAARGSKREASPSPAKARSPSPKKARELEPAVKELEPAAQPLTGLATLAKALDKPLLRRPRLVRTVEEATALFACPEQPCLMSWEAGEAAATALAAKVLRASRWSSSSIAAGELPCKGAVKAFLGRAGKNAKKLRAALQAQLDKELPGCRAHVWLDVKVEERPEPALEAGQVLLAAKARCCQKKLEAALGLLAEAAAWPVGQAQARAAKREA